MRDLENLATSLLLLLAEQREPLLVGVTDVEPAPDGSWEEASLSVLPCPSTGVLGELLGFVAPRDWAAIGVASPGRAIQLERPATAVRAVDAVHLTDRTGAHASAIQVDDRPPRTLSGGDGDPAGRVVDACRRALGLATPPPSLGVHHLWAGMWLDRLAVRLLEERQRLAWADLAMLHPAVSLARVPPPEPDELISLAESARPDSWTALRRACAAGVWDVEMVEPAVASWMDDGMFSRWVLEPFGPTVGLVDDLCRRLEAPVATALRRVVEAWDLDTAEPWRMTS